jgi:hypothetical protein
MSYKHHDSSFFISHILKLDFFHTKFKCVAPALELHMRARGHSVSSNDYTEHQIFIILPIPFVPRLFELNSLTLFTIKII